MSVDQVAEDILRGQPFIGTAQKSNRQEYSLPDYSSPRKCSLCFYRKFDDNSSDGDCHIAGDIAKKDFGFKPDEFLPTQLEGKEVAHYCRCFIPLSVK